jgi:hypothetical protein
MWRILYSSEKRKVLCDEKKSNINHTGYLTKTYRPASWVKTESIILFLYIHIRKLGI